MPLQFLALTTTEGTLRDTSVDREITERLTSIEDYTSGEIKSFDLPAILNWCSNFISLQLSQPYKISRIEEFENGIAALRAKRDVVASQVQAAKTNLEKVVGELT